MGFLAHSESFCGRAQPYEEHVLGVNKWILYTLEKWRPFLKEPFYLRIKKILLPTGENHDLGKLDEKNQDELHDKEHRGPLTFSHQYAGAMYLLRHMHDIFGAALIIGHHRPGLPNLNVELGSSMPFCGLFKKADQERKQFQEHIESHMDAYLKAHCKALGKETESTAVSPDKKPDQKPDEKSDKKSESGLITALEERMMLSCLVNADWSDTGRKKPGGPEIPRRWPERLTKLDAYVDEKAQGAKAEIDQKKHARNVLRQEFYQECRKIIPIPEDTDIYNCDACVGTGKTTSLLALALRFAMEKQLRHIIIVLPFISILTQTEDTIKEALCLPGENEKEVVTAIHCRAEYEDLKLRHLADAWEAPVILTTSVAFYETLASNTPTHLKKLQELPGSAIILDEFHASAPPECLPVIWQWLGELSRNWGCPVFLSSGTMVHFWDHVRFKAIYGPKQTMRTSAQTPVSIPMPVPKTVLSKQLQKKMEAAEQSRVQMRLSREDLEKCRFGGIAGLLDFALSQEGPRIIMVETREAAARIAHELKLRDKQVYHLSNAFKPEDCEDILKEVRQALKEAEKDSSQCDWTLVTTTYAGTGLDLSFRNGFCQIFSCAAYLQLIGRISRDDDYPDASLWAFELADPRLPENGGMKISKDVWRGMLQDGVGGVSVCCLPPSELADYAFREELKRAIRTGKEQEQLLVMERNYEFPEMAREFKIIPNEVEALAVVDPELVKAVRFGKHCDRAELRRKSVPIYESMAKRLGLDRIVENAELYELQAEQYDPELLGCFKTLIE